MSEHVKAFVLGRVGIDTLTLGSICSHWVQGVSPLCCGQVRNLVTCPNEFSMLVREGG